MSDGTRERAGRLRRLSIRHRLAVLVVLSVACLVVMAVPVTRDRLQMSRTANDVEATAEHLARVVALRSGVHGERVAVEAMLRGRAFGLPYDQVSQLLGFDVVATRDAAARQTDQAARAFGAATLPVDLDVLRAVRARVDGAAASGDVEAIVSDYTTIDRNLRQVMLATFDQLEATSGGLAGSSSLDDANAAVRAGTDLLDAVNDELRALQLMLFDADDAAPLVALADARARTAVAATRLDALRDTTLATGWREIRDGPELGHVRSEVDATLAGTPNGSGDDGLLHLAGISRDGLEAERRLYGYIDAAGAGISAEAASLSRQASAELARTLALTTVLALALVWASIRLSRSVRSPLQRLTAHAAAVSNGRLDIEPLGDDGPADIVTLMVGFDELVANLRLLEAKGRALAACNFDAPVLESSVPGALGESLQRSVQVLSGSLVERDELQRNLAHQATHDVLTGLHNRTATNTALEQALRRANRLGAGVAVLYIDLDEFKPVNDVHGHPVGDEVLRIVAARMADLVRESDFVARIGGDEFVVITESADDSAGVAELANRLIAVVSEPVTVGNLSVQVGASVGIAFALDGNEQADQLLTFADLAVYRAKQHGRGRAEIYNRNMQDELVARAGIRDALAHAIANDELYLDYQPVFTAEESVLCGVEALVRWDRPGHGILGPDSFIPPAEESPRLIIELDCWVLDAVARQLKEWESDALMAGLDVAVNISGRHLASRDLVEHVAAAVERWGIDPGRLVVEITETVLLNDLDVAAEQLERLRAMGIRIAIDDFGTGYTSVTHLARLPVDVLKIDRSFLIDRLDDRATTLLAMMIDLGHHLGLAITAEGVETPEQLRLLRSLDCDRTQGFLLGRPQAPRRLVERRAVPVPVAPPEP